jgi:L-cysteine:1D-myo-inositol 2-amino-2-deoxy-alpha-D-glucopyranoside ligase
MDAWPTIDLPELPGNGRRPRLYDTSTGALVATPVRSVAEGPARMYVCGITPYDAAHLGHAATYIAFDLVQRVWRDTGRDVWYVQNITDVDDPLLERANATNDDWRALARREIHRFTEDMAALRVLPPTHYIGAVESIPLVVELILRLRALGVTYEVDGDVYFSVHSDPSFGQVARVPRHDMREVFADHGGDPDRQGKKDPLDCLLWQAERPGEPAWDSPLGRGRPGWHVECAAIALRYLGMGFDVQGGGADLAFPHHEMSAAEAQVAYGQRPFAHSYVHAGLVALDGEKMSKSRGNLVFVSKLREQGADPMAIRLAILAHHYRSDWEWHDEDLTAAARRLARWRAAAATGRGEQRRLLTEVRERLSDDLDAPGALAAVDRWADAALAGSADAAATPDVDLAARALDALLGIAL